MGEIEHFDIEEASKVLDRDHYGLDKVKDTILQYFAVGKLKGSIQGKMHCLKYSWYTGAEILSFFCRCIGGRIPENEDADKASTDGVESSNLTPWKLTQVR